MLASCSGTEVEFCGPNNEHRLEIFGCAASSFLLKLLSVELSRYQPQFSRWVEYELAVISSVTLLSVMRRREWLFSSTWYLKRLKLKWQNRRTSLDHYAVTGQGVLSNCSWIVFRVPILWWLWSSNSICLFYTDLSNFSEKA